jgi:hypothetical protein
MVGRYTEGKAIDAVLQFLESRDHALRKDDGRSPDDLNDPDPQRRVDYVCTVGQLFYAFEHTGIEPFPNQIRLADHNQRLFGPIIERFDHRGDREVWDLHVPVEASVGLTEREVGQVQEALVKWIETNAGRVPVVPRYGRYGNPALGESAGEVPFRFSLHRTSLEGANYPSDCPLRGRFFLGPIAPSDLEQQRSARLKTASERKYPKLAKWKRDSGARTVLVLEEDDLWLTNHCRVADALVPGEATTPDAPDEVFLVSAGHEQKWWVVCLRGPGLVAGEPMPHGEFDPMELTKLTSR